jgi:NhaA family Na+:H+ antiporter
VFEIRLENLSLQKHLLHWINDGLMALFFLLVAVEVKHELIEGHLSSLAKVTFPTLCALAGVAVPAGIYLLCTRNDPVAVHGWAIPAATDIAFSLAVLGAFGRRVPRSLTAFLMALAVIDDLAAIVIIAVFYAGEISWTAQMVALAVTALLLLCNRLRVTKLGVYLVLGMILWVAVLKSGVHATLAGVVLGFAVPYRGRQGELSPMRELEQRLHPWVAIVVLPLFAFANSGISFTGFRADMLLHPASLGIALGLVLGKAAGVFGAGMLLAKLGLARLPEGSSWAAFLGVSVLAGIGFTMSMFIGTLAFEDAADYAAEVRIGVLAGSVTAAVCGALLLCCVLPKDRR